MKFICDSLFLFGSLLLAITAVNGQYDIPDLPTPYVPPPRDYIDDFKLLHDELDKPMNGIVRTYYIAADEVVWDYAQESKTNELPKDPSLSIWTTASSTTLGSKYYKALYREYSDETFSTLVERPHWQGAMGPILRAEVGDTIVIHFWNRASYNFTLHPHGVLYEFEMEGAVYKGATEESSIAPGHNYTYSWKALPRAGPGPNDGNSLVWGYHSHVTENDIYAGLFGAIVIYRPGKLTKEAVSEEVVTALFGSDENLSPYLTRTIKELGPQLDISGIQKDRTTRHAFYRSNVKQSINGIMYSSPSDLVVSRSSLTQWHLLGWGSFLDMHDVSWDNASVLMYGQKVENVKLFPASFRTVQVQATDKRGSFGLLKGKLAGHGMIMEFDTK
ncbi:Cupredoxin [Phycomyces blakesleeanus]|uniref:Cupredoxin n=1 Tax=Phycomyces blakesleeanus TaxID=4837 RepID=A0ABR3B1T2_PHYBL